jgi:hypothetical protein
MSTADSATDDFWQTFTAGYDRLAKDASAWAQVQVERASESPALADDC